MFDLEFEESESDNDITDFVPDDDSATEEVIDEPTTTKKARQTIKRKGNDFDDDVSVETVGYAPSIVDNSDDSDDESNEEEEDDDDNNQLNPDVPDMDWKMNCTGNHESLPFTGFTATDFTLEKDKRNGLARKTFF